MSEEKTLNTTISNVKIKGINTVVPSDSISLYDIENLYNGDKTKIDRIINSSGFLNRRVAKRNTTTGDLCYMAAKKLLEDLKIDKSTIDGLIFVSTTPDYFIPPTSCIIHNKLKLNDNCALMDINQACSGFLYGLWVGASLINSGLKRILILCGDTFNKYNDMFKNNSAPVFGDGGSATLIEYDKNADKMYFNIGSKTSEYKSIFCENGAFRNPPKQSDFYNNGEYIYNASMDGMKVFKFTTENVPISLKNVMKYSDTNIDTIDYCIMHQANKYILENIAKIIGIGLYKVPVSSISKYGNLVSASIPCAICDSLYNITFDKKLKVLLSGFGVGLTYMSAVITLDKIYCAKIINYECKEGD